MTDKCPYCGAEMPAQNESGAGCPVCGETPPYETSSYVSPPQTPPKQQTASESASEGFGLPASEGSASRQDYQYHAPPRQAHAQPATPPTDYSRFKLAWEGDDPLLKGLWRTIWQVLLHPVNSFRAPALPGQAWALAFGLIMGTFGMAMQVLWSKAFNKPDMIPMSALWWLVLSPFIILAGLYINTVIMHLGLLMAGGARRGFKSTFRVVGYSEAAAIFYLVPFLGMAIAGIWGLVILIGGLAGAHGISGWRVVLAIVLIFVIIAAITTIAILIFGMGVVMGLFAQMGARGSLL